MLKKILVRLPPQSGILGAFSIDKITELIQRLRKGDKKVHIEDTGPLDKAKCRPILGDEPTGIVQLSEGCLGNCAYCCTKNARGRLHSFSHTDILDQCRYFLSHGRRELYLTAQDLGVYNDNGILLHHLLKEIDSLDGKFWMRLGMLNPQYLIKYWEEFQEVFQSEKFFKFLHIPVQSASNEVLKRMNRSYKIEDVRALIAEIRQWDPKITIATDIICGFPGETKQQWEETTDFIRWLNPPVLNISKFTARPHTAAKKMTPLRSQEVKRRSKELTKIFTELSYKQTSQWIGWTGEMLVDENHSNHDYPYMGRNRYYIPILLKDAEIGEFYVVKIKKKKKYYLIGEIIE